MEFSLTKEREVKKFFVIFYIVGTVGMLVPFTFQLFKFLIPFTLILNFFYLAFFHSNNNNIKTIIVLLFIFLSSLLIEIIGVNTGKIFGSYEYGRSLGIKVFETPIIIGINWVFLIYTSAEIVEKLKIKSFIKIIMSSTIMLMYDIVLEQVAPKLDMWHWENDIVPVENYIAWFIIAFFYHSVIKIFKIKIQNPLALIILSCQFIFFVILFLFFR